MIPLLFGPILIAAAAVAALAATKGRARLTLSRAKHKGLTGHVRWGKRIAAQIPFYHYDDATVFRADGAPDEVAARRRAGFDRLAALYAERFAKTAALTAEVKGGLSDLQFTARYRVPFQFSAQVRDSLAAGSFVASAEGVTVTDLDGNRCYDLTGSYGVNLLGTDAYKAMIRDGVALAEPIGLVLGGLHPVVADNVRRLRSISGLDEVSFHMSGTEAVMQAVRLARYHTGRSHVVRFAGAYNGWWEDVQPGVGNPTPADRTYTLADMSERTLKVLATRRDIACVIVNPVQAMHPNASAPGDGALVDSSRRSGVDREGYAAWLRRLQAVCAKAGIVFIMDEVFTGFRLASGGACEYFGVRPDMVTYGKTLGGGLPVGAVCGRADLMKRWRDDRPVDICFARGTFKEHPYVMGAMDAFLRWHASDAGASAYDGLDERWNARAAAINARLAAEDLPLRVANLGTIWSVNYLVPSRYNWMLQYYARAEGLALSWVGTGRMIWNFAYTDADVAAVADRLIAAAAMMRADGWWWAGDGVTNKALRRQVLREVVRTRIAGASGGR